MSSPAPLSGKQRRQLRALAHDLAPVVMVGREGVNDAVVAATDHALTDHELIKVRILDSAPQDRTEVGPLLASRCRAHAVGTIGRVAILYRRHPTEPKVPLQT
ncbi:MAG: ribosome assembly RNA-binding protein YhbY [Myxococcales bacterium]|nr:ribosome assembly RNA-binding protein YhbY [Myxococcales bacterium]